MITLIVRGAGHKYGYKRIFAGVGATLQPGTVLAITGMNGSGKSTLLKIMAGILRPTDGDVGLIIPGKVIPEDEYYLHVGVVAPYVNMYRDLTLRENLMFITRARAMRTGYTRIRKVVSMVGLTDQIDDPVKTYSTGMQQRAHFAAALLHEPTVLLFDEPTLGLDEEGRNIFESIIAGAQKAGNLVVIASNTQNDIALANRSLCIEDYAPSYINFARRIK